MSLPVFPLPGVVLFPGTEVSVELVEARYRSMVRHCLKPDRDMVLALLIHASHASSPTLHGSQGPEHVLGLDGRSRNGERLEARGEEEDQQPVVCSIAAWGRVISAKELSEGRWRAMVRGVSRVEIVDAQPPARPFRVMRCEVRETIHDGSCLVDAERCLRDLALRLVDTVPGVKKPLLDLLDGVAGVELADQIACRLIPDPLVRQGILEELEARPRFERVIREVAEVCLRADPSCKAGAGPRN